MMRRFDDSCLTPIHEFRASEIRALREREEVSQSVFGSHSEKREGTTRNAKGATRAS